MRFYFEVLALIKVGNYKLLELRMVIFIVQG